MKLTYFAHSAFALKTEDHCILFDPFITNNPRATIPVDDITDVTHIFITHGHGDHIGDTVELAKRWNPQIICNYELGHHLSTMGVENIHTMHIGGRSKLDFATVKMTPALHGSGILKDGEFITGGVACGFLVEIEGKKIYHAGDTGLTIEMQLLTDEDIDVALLPIGGNYTMDIADAVKAVTMIKPKLVIPMHYNTFGPIEADPQDFARQVTGAKVTVLDFGQTIEI